MAHFAQLDENDIVLRVIVVNNDVVNNLEFPDSEPIGIEFCRSLYGKNTTWRQTSYNNKFRKRFATIGSFYIDHADVFVRPKPLMFDYFVLDSNYEWVPPVPMPDENWVFSWGKFEETEDGKINDLAKAMLDQGVTDPTLLWNRTRKPYESWIASPDRTHWRAPVQYPNDNKAYKWDEDTISWIEIVSQ